MKIQLLLTSLLIMFYPRFSNGQPGSLDPSFSNDGVIYPTLIEGISSEAANVLVQNDGKILTTGSSYFSDELDVVLLTRCLSDGGDDYSFNGSGKVVLAIPGLNTYGMTSIQQPDGKILTLAGKNENTEDAIALFCTNIDGSPDIDFGTEGFVLVNIPISEKAPRNMARQNDSKLVICGYVKNEGDPYRKSLIARCKPDGTLDPSFNGIGYVTTTLGAANSQTESISIQPDGKIVAAGYGIFNGKENIVVLRFKPNGTPDSSFHENGIARITVNNADIRARSVLVQADGKIIVGGYIHPVGSNSDFVAARLDQDGNLDPDFNGDGIARISLTPYDDQARAMILQPDGKIVLGGYVHSNSDAMSTTGLLRLTKNGYPDPSFGVQGFFETDCFTQENFILGMALQPDGKIIGAGKIYVSDFSKGLVARFLTGVTVSTEDLSPLITSVSVYPNPIMEEISIEYQLEKEETLSIRLVDLHGRIIETLLHSANRHAGQHKETFTIEQDLMAGSYIIQIRTKNGIHTTKVIVF